MSKHNQIKIHALLHATEDNTLVTPKHKRIKGSPIELV